MACAREIKGTTIGATNALCETARTFWRTHIDHKINRAPINAQIKR